ncbi:NUDIX domain-containing protein [Agrobacterium vitis]|uniref:NUDIX domain-containing protein n=1 Tax=Agrobacterium vitis TaxID=373 RepID=A0ABW9THJ4_AGRVI|nr:NUDIX domain-containing protein [Agrobacterium vitis]MUO43009.1 NUDIX domain-containing protein [Agrobacterium vitis]
MSFDYIMRLRAKIGKQLLLLPSVAAVIRDDHGRILFQEKASGEGWSLPAGGIEPGETPEEAIRREVLEETGLVVEDAELLNVFGGKDFRYTYPNGDEVEYTVVLFGCTTAGEAGTGQDPETRRVKFISRDEMPRLALPYPVDVLFQPWLPRKS